MRQAFIRERVPKNQLSFFSTKTYVVGTQKNHLNETVETVLLSTQDICLNGGVRIYLQFYAQKLCFSKPMLDFDSYCICGKPHADVSTEAWGLNFS